MQKTLAPAPAASRRGRCLGLTIVLLCLTTRLAESATFSLTWNQSPESDVVGYILSYGTATGQYTATIDVGNTTTYVFSAPDATKTYYLAVRAYDTAGLISPYSNETSTPPPTTPLLRVTNLVANLPSPQLAGV